MELYDKKIIRCYRCGQSIGEVDVDAEVPIPKCGQCAHPFPMIGGKAYAEASK